MIHRLRFFRLSQQQRPSKALLLGWVWIAVAFPAWTEVKAPNWAMLAAQVQVPAYGEDVSACVLLREDTLSVDAKGHAVLYHREVRKILHPQGRPKAEITVGYNQGSKMEFLHVWTVEPDGHVYAVKRKDIVDVAGDTATSDAVFDDTHLLEATAIGADTGSVIAFEYKQALEPYLTTQLFDLQEGNLPALQQSVRLELPPGATYKVAWKDLAPVVAVQDGENSWDWAVPAQPAMPWEPLAPARQSLHAEMLLSYSVNGAAMQSGDWRNIGQWYEHLAADRTEDTPEIAAQVAQLTAGKTSFMDKLLAITGYMQDHIRYVAIEMGVGGWQPHPAPMVFQNQYGDCKDKATLLIAMLRDAGIQAHYLIVDFHRGYIAPEFPSQFADHMITAIDLPPGLHDARLQSVVTGQHGQRYLVFDPTNPESPAGQLENELQGSYGLLIDGANTQVLHLPVAAPEQNTLARTGHFQLTADGALSGTLRMTYAGPDATRMRYLFHSGYEQGERKAIEQALREEQAGFTLVHFHAEHAADRTVDFVLQEELSAGSYVRQAGTMWLVRPHVALSDVLPTDTTKPRQYPVEFNSTDLHTEDYTIDLPAGFTVVDVPKPVHWDYGFATYSSTTVATANQIHYTSAMRILQMELPANEYGKFVQLMQQIRSNENNAVLLQQSQ